MIARDRRRSSWRRRWCRASREILALKYEATRELLRKAGELGLLGIEIPEEYGGLGLDKVSGCLVSEKSARDGSFAVSFMGHTGIGTPAHRLLRHRGAEEEVPAQARHRRVDQLLLALRGRRPPATP